MQIHLHIGDQTSGPFTVEQINEQLRYSNLSADSILAWYEGCEDWIPLTQIPGVASPFQAPPIRAAGPLPEAETPPPLPFAPKPYAPEVNPRRAPLAMAIQRDDAPAKFIPEKNTHAYPSLFLGIAGLLPLIGIFLAIPAVILGISGVKQYTVNPAVRGSGPAWTGLILGALSIGYHLLALLVVSIVLAHRP